MIVKLLVDGGNMKPGPAVGQKLGPLGVNLGKVIEEVNSATANFKGIKVPIELNIDKQKNFSVNVLSPPTTELLKKELGIEKASGEAEKIKVANASIEQIISVAKTKYPNMLANNFKSAVKTVVGTCVSAGILIENKPAKDIEKEISSGRYDKEIEEMKTETDPEKKKKLNSFFSEIKTEQDAVLKKEEEEKAAEEAKKAEEAEKAEKPEEAEKPEAAEEAEKQEKEEPAAEEKK